MKGGKRPGAGRPKGGKGKRTKALEQALVLAQQATLTGEYTSLTLLQAVYRDDRLPLELRVEAAFKAAPYEHAKLATVNLGAQAGSITFNFGRHGDTT